MLRIPCGSLEMDSLNLRRANLSVSFPNALAMVVLGCNKLGEVRNMTWKNEDQKANGVMGFPSFILVMAMS